MTKLQVFPEEYPTGQRVLMLRTTKKQIEMTFTIHTLGLEGHIQSTRQHLPMSGSNKR